MFVTIKAKQPVKTPPTWALLERQLFDAISDAAPAVLRKYTRSDGSLLWPTKPGFKSIDGLDDCYESFHNWPLFYLLGGDEWFLTQAQREFDSINQYMAQYDSGFGYPMVVKEYQPSYDWFHQGEGNYLFYMLCMADPSNAKTIQRAQQFAGFYLNEDPDVANYDPEHKIIPCARNGSKGPAFWTFTGSPYWPWPGYNLPFYDVPGCTDHESVSADPELPKRLGKAMQERQGKGDSVINLAATSLIANAYLLTGEEKYRAWVQEYVEAWMDRAEQNHGIVPDNIGLSGSIGEHIRGKWYGGNYGWTWPHGWHSVGQAVGIASQNATLMMRDPGYMDFVRSQIDVLISKGVEQDDQLYVPYKYGDPGKVSYAPGAWLQYPLKNEDGTALQVDGWFEFMPMHPSDVAHLWTMSMNPQDLKRFERIRKQTGSRFPINTWYHTKDQGGHDGAWLSYLQGEYPEYPEAILKHNLHQVQDRLAFMEKDQENPEQYRDSYFQRRNPVTCEGLVHLTLGGPLPHYNGGLLISRLRYFDAQRKQPGLPPDVGALVSRMDAEVTELQLVNLSKTEAREVLIQAGAMGEHQFTDVSYESNGDNKTVPVDDRCLHVNLPPSTRLSLDLHMRRFANTSSYKNAMQGV